MAYLTISMRTMFNFTSVLIHLVICSIDSALSKLTKCISDIQSWMTCNMLKLNNDKTEFFVALSPLNKRRMPAVKLHIGNTVIEPTETLRKLGVIFDTQMDVHVHQSYFPLMQHHLPSSQHLSPRHYLDFETCNHVVRSLILSRLDYGNILLWVRMSLKLLVFKDYRIGQPRLFFL